MKAAWLSLLSALMFAAPVHAELPAAPKPVDGGLFDSGPSGLDGRWRIDLIQGMDGKPSEEVMTIASSGADTLQGGFLGSAFTVSRVRKVGADVVFFAQTAEGGQPIYHSARLSSGRLTGQSYFSGRRVLMPWTGVRLPE